MPVKSPGAQFLPACGYPPKTLTQRDLQGSLSYTTVMRRFVFGVAAAVLMTGCGGTTTSDPVAQPMPDAGSANVSDLVPDFALLDTNSTSSLSGQFGYLDQMMNELSSEHPGAVQLLAVNEVGFESSTDGMAELGDIPLLQDTAATNAWSTWNAVYRDVILVDAEGQKVEAYDLSKPENYAALKAKLQSAAGL
jgi:hypothetical protein